MQWRSLKTWRAEMSWRQNADLVQAPNEQNECLQSFVLAQISELLFRDVATRLGPEMNSYDEGHSLHNGLSTEASRSSTGEDEVRELYVVSLVEKEALQLALEAGVVWPSLTAMVTIENDARVEAALDVEVCQDNPSGNMTSAVQ